LRDTAGSGVTVTRWSTLLGLAGLAVSLYLTVVHYAQGAVPLACSAGGVVNCELVTSSAQSAIGPLPVALLGVVWFAVYLALVAARTGGVFQLAWTATGLAFVFYLVYAEMFLIGALCLWCTVVHLIVIGLFLLAIAQSSADVAEEVVA
jgi:uncharacterized membrane protein